MNKIEKTYKIMWLILFAISLLLIFTLPSIFIYYNGFSSSTLSELGVANEALESLSKGLNIVDGVLPKNLGITNVAKVALSYVTAYVPQDFPKNNLPVKFWSSVVFLIIAFIQNIIIVCKTLRKINTNDDAFFNIPIVLQSILCLIISIVLALFVVINDRIYYFVGIILYVIFLLLTLILFVGLDALKSNIKQVDFDNKIRKSFIDELKLNVDILKQDVNNKNIEEKLNKLSEEVRYSISVSNEKTKELEEKINDFIYKIKKEIELDNTKDISEDIDKIVKLINQRNLLAKN